MSGFILFCTSADEGREGHREVQKSSFKLDVNASGRNYVTMVHDEVSKNHPGGLKDTSSTEKYAQMYETDSPTDGYKAVKPHLSKLNPKSSAFFQYPSRNWAPQLLFGMTTSRSASTNLTTWWRILVRQLSCREFIPTAQSVPQQSPSGWMLESLTGISWRFLAIGMSRAWLTTTHALQLLSFYTAVKSFPAIFKGPQH